MIPKVQADYNLSFNAVKMPKYKVFIHCWNGKVVEVDDKFISSLKKEKPSFKDIILEIFPMLDSRYRDMMKKGLKK